MQQFLSNAIPEGGTKLLIHELRKAIQNKKNALTEIIDDAIDAVNNSPSSIINVTYDKDKRTLKVSDFGYGIGMDSKTCEAIVSKFFSHCFSVSGISKFGLGRFYAFAMLGNHPNIHFRSSTGSGSMCEAVCEVKDIEKDDWTKMITDYPCEKGTHGTEVTIEDVDLSDEELKDMRETYRKHYAMVKSTIILNGEPINKFNPCYIEKLPDGIETPDGVYVIEDEEGMNRASFAFIVTTHVFRKDSSVVRLKTATVSITKNGLKECEKYGDSFAAPNAGIYMGLSSNILNKGNNALEFFNIVMTRGGSGATRMFIKVLEDNDNVLSLNDVKVLGYEPFFLRRFKLNEYKNVNGEGLYDVLADAFKECKGLYNQIGQGKHEVYTVNEVYSIVSNSHNIKTGTPKKVKQRKVCNTIESASKDVHVQYIEHMYDYVTERKLVCRECGYASRAMFDECPNCGSRDIDRTSTDDVVIDVSIPKNEDKKLRIEVNARNLPPNFPNLTKEDILLGVSKFLIEGVEDPLLFEKWNSNIKKYLVRYDN